MINNVTLVGRLTKDPELKYTPNGVANSTFTLAVNRQFTSQGGEREADFINCVVWRKSAENVANFLKKGSLAGVIGRIQTRNYENQEGKRVYITEVVAESVQFLEPKGSGGGGGNNQALRNASDNISNNNRNQNNNNGNQWRGNEDPFAGNGQIDISDDDLPF